MLNYRFNWCFRYWVKMMSFQYFHIIFHIKRRNMSRSWFFHEEAEFQWFSTFPHLVAPPKRNLLIFHVVLIFHVRNLWNLAKFHEISWISLHFSDFRYFPPSAECCSSQWINRCFGSPLGEKPIMSWISWNLAEFHNFHELLHFSDILHFLRSGA